MQEKIKEILNESIKVKQRIISEHAYKISQIAEIIIKQLKEGKKILICGNGGSAADSQHFACELIGRFKNERRSLPAIALTTDTSIITALSNDYSFETVFSRQVEGLGNPNDILFCISTSGNSKNVYNAILKSKKMGLITIGLLGGDGGIIKNAVDYSLIVPASDCPRIQEAHISIIHTLCELIESNI